ncbi:MAG TPA: polymer-forming cytoskeletal protein [Gammaproteobacteria bacterium]
MDIKQLKDNLSKKLHHTLDAGDSDSAVEDVSAKYQNTPPINSVKSPGSPMAIGATIHIKGDVTGDEDLIIHGHVEGQINLKEHNVIIGPKGSVQANIHAKQIVVEGELKGDLNGEEKVIIRKTGNVLGNVVSPRVTLEDGCMFKGSIEMGQRDNKSFGGSYRDVNAVDKNTKDKQDSMTVKSNVM